MKLTCSRCHRSDDSAETKKWIRLAGRAYCLACTAYGLDRIEEDIIRLFDWRAEPEEGGDGSFLRQRAIEI